MGHKISKDGIGPLERKLDAINEFPVPRNIKELRSLLGMAQQLAIFSPELANAAEPLRDLLSSKSVWLWTDNHITAFETVKIAL